MLLNNYFNLITISLLISCTDSVILKVIDVTGKPIYRAAVIPQPIVLYGSGNQTDRSGKVVVHRLGDNQIYSISKEGHSDTNFEFDVILKNPVVVLTAD